MPRRLLELIRFSHTVFALPFALLAAIMAWTAPPPPGAPAEAASAAGFQWRQLLAILVCLTAARGAAMAYNRLADRDVDALNPRTRGRHLPAGLLSVSTVVLFTLACAAVFVAGTLLLLPNWLPLALALPVLAFLVGYSHAKRFTSLAHFWLGAALMLAPVCAWIAARGALVLARPDDLLPAAALGLAVLFWVAGFDIIYACQDAEFDRSARLRSVPARWGVAGALRIAAACHVGMLAVLAALPFTHYLGGPELPLGGIHATGLAAVALLLAYEHALVRADDLSRVNLAFFHVNAVVSVGLLVVTSLDLLW